MSEFRLRLGELSASQPLPDHFSVLINERQKLVPDWKVSSSAHQSSALWTDICACRVKKFRFFTGVTCFLSNYQVLMIRALLRFFTNAYYTHNYCPIPRWLNPEPEWILILVRTGLDIAPVWDLISQARSTCCHSSEPSYGTIQRQV